MQAEFSAVVQYIAGWAMARRSGGVGPRMRMAFCFCLIERSCLPTGPGRIGRRRFHAAVSQFFCQRVQFRRFRPRPNAPPESTLPASNTSLLGVSSRIGPSIPLQCASRCRRLSNLLPGGVSPIASSKGRGSGLRCTFRKWAFISRTMNCFSQAGQERIETKRRFSDRAARRPCSSRSRSRAA